jgi:hypothetical protein
MPKAKSKTGKSSKKPKTKKAPKKKPATKTGLSTKDLKLTTVYKGEAGPPGYMYGRIQNAFDLQNKFGAIALPWLPKIDFNTEEAAYACIGMQYLGSSVTITSVIHLSEPKNKIDRTDMTFASKPSTVATPSQIQPMHMVKYKKQTGTFQIS